MIKVSVLYPKKDKARFDEAYYFAKHIPMVVGKFGAALKGVSVEQGVGGALPGSSPAFLMLAHFTFDSVGAFQKAILPHAHAIMADVSKFTSIEPVVQVSEVKVSK